MKINTSKAVICYGEILWDILPNVKRPGGAPMNVAYHLQKLAVNSTLISSVGDDALGRSLLDFVHEIGLSVETIQVHEHQPTSEVVATVSAEHEVRYEIVYPVAWDFIHWLPAYETLLKGSTALVYGSLASRNDVSADTLLTMLGFQHLFKVFDVNLRAPHYSPKVIDRLLKAANLLKVNAEELGIICSWYDGTLHGEAAQVEYLFENFDVEEVLITKGAAGASYYTREHHFEQPAFAVEVNDTIGSGDSFLAAFLTKRLQQSDPASTLEYAVAMGAFITAQSGACPPYEKADFEAFLIDKRPVL
jgi:fructokinase